MDLRPENKALSLYRKRQKKGSSRKLFVLVHRYVGLLLTGFLILEGLTGSILAFYNPLDHWLNPELFSIRERNVALLAPMTLLERAEGLEPHGRVSGVNLRVPPDTAYSIALEPRIDLDSGKPFVLGYDELLLDPYSGEKIGTRDTQAAYIDKQHLLAFIYRLHMNLALPEAWMALGVYTLGVVAVLWTLDCFVGFYLTLPTKGFTNGTTTHRFLERWKPAWQIKRSRFTYDLHRASGLWVWPMLLIFAWSSVFFELDTQVYRPVMSLLFDMPKPVKIPLLQHPLETPKLGWRTAYTHAQKLVGDIGRQSGFQVNDEWFFSFDRERGVYDYSVRTSNEWGENGATSIAFDANTGIMKSLHTPSLESNGETITRWLWWLHMAAVFGLPMKVFVCAMGFLIVALSVTGVIIWWRKRRSAKHQKAHSAQLNKV
jgi:uncharacterized iron-regulated membrane protein